MAVPLAISGLLFPCRAGAAGSPVAKMWHSPPAPLSSRHNLRESSAGTPLR